MEAKIFKTKALAENYFAENYKGNDTVWSSISDANDWEAIDMPNFSWSGEIGAVAILDAEGNTIEKIAWWEDGTDVYEIYVGGVLKATFDNNYDAREAMSAAIEEQEDEDEPKEVRFFINGEDETV